MYFDTVEISLLLQYSWTKKFSYTLKISLNFIKAMISKAVHANNHFTNPPYPPNNSEESSCFSHHPHQRPYYLEVFHWLKQYLSSL